MHSLKGTIFLGLRSLFKTRILFVFEAPEAAVDIRYAGLQKLTNGDCGPFCGAQFRYFSVLKDNCELCLPQNC